MTRPPHFFNPSGAEMVSAPEPYRQVFAQAERLVAEFFREVHADPSRGTVDIGGERYVLVRASALSMEFLDTICHHYADRGKDRALAIGQALLFDISHSIGMADARSFHQRADLHDPLDKLSAGPVHFAYTGWACVKMLPESHPTPDENYFLLYDHPFSFEADAWVRAERQAAVPICTMNSGYSSGWCEESFGMPLTAVEVQCRARGDRQCRFVMAPPDRLEEHLHRLGFDLPRHRQRGLGVPTFFERKQIEDRMRQMQSHLISASRRAGLAEAATGVLHNLGNVLNGFHSSLHQLKTSLRHSESANLARAVQLMQEQQDLADFLRNDERGRRLPGYLKSVSQKLSEEQQALRQQVERLSTKLAHAESILKTQQEAARSRGVVEGLPLTRLVDDACTLAETTLERHGALVDLSQVQAGWVEVDRQNVLQILTNLLINAAEAMAESDEPRKVVIEARVLDQVLEIDVSDQGQGVAPEHRNSIFAHGFTTKAEGQGFGLHSAANLAQQMGGRLELVDPGPGACFRLRLPLPLESLDG